MKSVHKSVLIWHSAQQMYELVTDVPSYSEFLPWCDHARIVRDEEDGVTAEVGIAFKGVRRSFTTRNHHTPGREVRLHLVDGPFSTLEGRWQFTPVGAPDQHACRIDLALDYAFASRVLSALVGPVFDHIANSLVDAFVKRADIVYGRPATRV